MQLTSVNRSAGMWDGIFGVPAPIHTASQMNTAVNGKANTSANGQQPLPLSLPLSPPRIRTRRRTRAQYSLQIIERPQCKKVLVVSTTHPLPPRSTGLLMYTRW